jgi:hypothetical protein
MRGDLDATHEDIERLRTLLEQVSYGFGSRVGREPDGTLTLRSP